jgi:nitroreductase
MAEFSDVLKQRRSIRRYKDRPVPEQSLAAVLEAVKWSPSWANTQCWEIVVVTDPEVKARLQACLPPKGNPAARAMVDAPVVLAVCGKKNSSGYYINLVTTKFGDWFMFDLGIATQSICLAAWNAGLGTVVVGLFDHDRAAAVLGVPEGYELVVMIPMGYPAKQPSAPKRREVGEFTHRNRFRTQG